MGENVVQSHMPPTRGNGEDPIPVSRLTIGHVAEAFLALALLVVIGGALAVGLQGSSRIVGLIGVGALLTILALWKLPKWQAEAAMRHNPNCDLFATENAARTTLAQALGGFLLIGGLAASCSQLYEARQEQRQSWELAQQGQLTDRFNSAVDQLSNSETVVVLGGIYALERIAYDSPQDAIASMETLAAFVQARAATPSKADGPIAEDVQAALNAIGRIGRGDWAEWLPGSSSSSPTAPWCLDLSGVYLPGVVLNGGMFPSLCLQDAHLTNAVLIDVDLSKADLTGADLSGAWFIDVNLSSAVLKEAVLTRAWLVGATLRATSLDGANLAETKLIAADFDGAAMDSVNLKDAWLVAGGCGRLAKQVEFEKANARVVATAIIRQWGILRGSLRPDRTSPDFRGALHLTREQINAAALVDATTLLPDGLNVPADRGCGGEPPHGDSHQGNADPTVTVESTPIATIPSTLQLHVTKEDQ